MTTIETAAIHPIRLVESGPAGGAIFAARIAERTQSNEVLSFDMGGTTAKLCLIDGYKPQHARKFEIARAARFIKGSGMPVRIPVLEMIEIGAGGGSIAGVDSLGRLQVGPQSAGSEPGPAAFGKGGEEATVTDSDIMLGYIDPKTFAEGRIGIDRELAAAALEKCVGASLDLSPIAAAFGVSEIVDEAMASAGRMHAVESGKDLSSRLMIAFGGNGPLHATRVARRAGINRILIPTEPGVGSAVGFLFAPVSFELVRSKYATLDHLPIDELNRFFSSMIGEAEGVVRAATLNLPLECRRTAFMRYHGQGHEIEISLPDRPLTNEDVERIKADFETEYSRQFSRAVPGMKIEILNWSVRVSTASSPASKSTLVAQQSNPGPVSHRRIQCDVTNLPVDVPVYERSKLVPGDTVSGPALDNGTPDHNARQRGF